MQNEFWNQNSTEWTQVIDTEAIRSRRITNPALMKVIGEEGVKSILDIGCGEGWLARALPDGVDYVGIDGAPELIKAARTRSRHQFEIVRFEQLTSSQWVPNSTYEAVIFNFSLLEETLVPLLKSAARYLRPQGKIIIQTLHPCFQLREYRDGWNSEDFRSTRVEFKGSMPWYGRTLESWSCVFQQAGLLLSRVVEPSEEGLPTSIVFILVAEHGF